MNMLASFVWPSATPSTPSAASTAGDPLKAASPQTLAALATAAAALGGVAGGDPSLALAGAGPGVSMACIPFLAPGWDIEDDPEGTRSEDGLSTRARFFQRALAGTCFAQASIATLEFAMHDGISGLIGCAVAAMGMKAASPGGYRFLPTYVVLAFCNGTMQVLLSAESHSMLIAPAAKMGVKLAALLSISHPVLMFVGVAVAWNFHCELRNLVQAPPGLLATLLPGQAEADGAGVAAGGSMEQGGGFRPFAGQPQRLHGEAK